MKTDIEIADSVKLKDIAEIAAKIGLSESDIIRYGNSKAKISADAIKRMGPRRGKLVLVTAMTPTPMGEGKTTVGIGLADGFAKIGKNVCLALREPSLGPCFGIKGGAAGGGYSQVAPMADINLHFNGDLHALTAANNLLCSMLDNHLHFGNELDIQKVFIKRSLDLNDRVLRSTRIGFGKVNGPERDDGFIITVATELMAALCLCYDIFDLKKMCGNIAVGENSKGELVFARDLKADGAMAALLRDAALPNLVQTLEGVPAIIHGGPFANIAHGCNSIIATDCALRCADYVITEAGFGGDLGAEKFMDIKCRKAGLKPDVVVIVTTQRANDHHGGLDNLARHIENMQKFGAPVVVAVNRASQITDDEYVAIEKLCARLHAPCAKISAWENGGIGGADLATAVIDAVGKGKEFSLLYRDNESLVDKTKTVALEIYRADSVEFSELALEKIALFEKLGFGHLPVCIAKTPLSFSHDPKVFGAPTGFIFPITDAVLYSGAGMVVMLAGSVMRMPGLPERPAAEKIDIDENGKIVGLF